MKGRPTKSLRVLQVDLDSKEENNLVLEIKRKVKVGRHNKFIMLYFITYGGFITRFILDPVNKVLYNVVRNPFN